MARLNITIPDDLYAALMPWRDRLNISKICQEALAREVAKLNDLPRQVADLSALIERLQQEKVQVEKFAYAQGVTDGITWATGASYEDLRRWGENGASPAAQRGDGEHALHAALQRYQDDPAFDAPAYREGWQRGIDEIWQRVRDKV